MSRIGNAPVYFDDKVNVTITPDNTVVVKGGKSEIKVEVNPVIKPKIEDGKVVFDKVNNEPQTRAFHGLYRALVQNAVTGVSTGWTKVLELNGVGYRANVSGKVLELNLGYSHPIKYDIPDGIEIKVDKQTSVTVTGADRALVGQVAAKIRGFREPEPYLGKGVKYADERIRRKAGKSAGK
ncbi:MAG: 50S ribosomal protein L6 [Bdellovibrionaceae bacterium]|nr:50S ribosomal protein L6 [Pseudobdellovibrionaceae bacterium]|tara:strand:- start:241 stop:783 length:543 start_codon:yes stop_codon:yes gene_type:complete